MNELGEAVRAARQQAKLSQRVVANGSGISLRALRDIEHGRVRIPRAKSVERLAETLQAPALLAHRAVRPDEESVHHETEGKFLLRILGPLGVARRCVPLNAGTPMQQRLLGLMALHANQRVPHTEIVDVLWGEDPPDSFNQLIHTYISRLRALLAKHQDASTGTPRIVRRNAGYELQIGTDQLDLLQFHELTGKAEYARASGDFTLEARHLVDALELWSGTVLEGLGARLRERPLAVECSQRMLSSALRLADLAESSGHSEQMIDRLGPLVRQHPLHEGLHARLMRALAQSGRQVEALELFNGLDRTLRTEFGIEPGTELRAAQMSVLRGASAMPPGTARTGVLPDEGPPERPYELPLDTPDLVGRIEHHPLLVHLTQGDSRTGGLGCPSPIASLYGPTGSGKSVLAIRAANSGRLHYVDGVLYADMRHKAGETARPYSVLRRFLQALGVPESEVPQGLEERVTAYRSVLADRRVLVVIDNVSEEGQIQPLLPGGFGSAALLTSRSPLVGIPGARHFRLSLFSTEQGVRLLSRIVGEEEVQKDPEAAVRICELCGHLPLAIRVAGLRTAVRPHLSLGQMAERLRDEGRRLSELVYGDLDVSAWLSRGFASLGAATRSAVRRLAVNCAEFFSLSEAEAALNSDPVSAAELLDTLIDHQVLEGPDERGLFALSPLTRLYAGRLAG